MCPTATHLGDPSRTIRGMLGANCLYSSLESSHLSRSKMCAVKCCNTHSRGKTVEVTLRMSVCGLTSLTVQGGLRESTAHTGVSVLRPTWICFNNALPIHVLFLYLQKLFCLRCGDYVMVLWESWYGKKLVWGDQVGREVFLLVIGQVRRSGSSTVCPVRCIMGATLTARWRWPMDEESVNLGIRNTNGKGRRSFHPSVSRVLVTWQHVCVCVLSVVLSRFVWHCRQDCLCGSSRGCAGHSNKCPPLCSVLTRYNTARWSEHFLSGHKTRKT